MSNVTVERVPDPQAIPPTLFDQMVTIAEKIRSRAFEVFQNRGGAHGRSIDDWLQAERDLFQRPDAELMEKDGKFHLRIAVSGFDAQHVHVTAMPGALIVRAEAKHTHQRNEGEVHFCEFGQRQLFRKLDLPAPINPGKVSAVLDQGILHLTAEKTVDAGKQGQSNRSGTALAELPPHSAFRREERRPLAR
jgi:HSP20 family molecular chaperone IbpA